MVDISFTMLNALRTLARNANVANAADELQMTPAGLRQSIQALEKRIGIQLFQPTRNGLVLSKAGERFSAEIADSFTAFSAACSSIFDFAGGESHVRIAYSMITEHELIEPLSERCGKAGIDLSLRRMWTANIPSAVDSGEVDLGFARHPHSWGQLRVETLWTSDLVALVPLSHRLADREQISIYDLAEETVSILPRWLSPGAYDSIEAAFLRAGIVPTFAKMSGLPDLEGRYGLNPACIGLGPIMLSSDIRTGIRQIPLREAQTIGLHAISRYNDALHGPVSKVLSYARAIADDRSSELMSEFRPVLPLRQHPMAVDRDRDGSHRMVKDDQCCR
jgi:DNA-binding transcriptional LysR family regulator